jgi:hypothetical protein
MQLYHGSKEDNLTVVTDSGLFGGVFASCDYNNAYAHGDFVYTIDLNDDEVIMEEDLSWGLDYEKVLNTFVEVTGHTEQSEEFDKIWGYVIEDKSMSYDEFDADMAWEYQRMRGEVAKKLGYKAVSMRDEHGTSYLVLPGAKMEII